MLKIVQYEEENGSSPFAQWFDGLDVQAALKVRTALARMEAGNPGDVKPVGSGVSERRIDFGPGYRVYFGQDGQQLIVLLAGGTKRRQQQDIERAKEMWAAYKARKRKGE